MPHVTGHDPFGPGKDLSNPATFSSIGDPKVPKAPKTLEELIADWKASPQQWGNPQAWETRDPRTSVTQNINNAMRSPSVMAMERNIAQKGKDIAAAQATRAANAAAVPFAQRGMPATLANLEGLLGAQQGPRLGAPITTTTSPGFVRQTPAQRAAIAAQEAAATQRAQEAALAISEYGVPDPSIRRFGPDLSPLEFADPNYVPPKVVVKDPPDDAPLPLCGENQIEINGECHDLPPGRYGLNPPGGSFRPPADAPAPVSDTMRSLYGELSTRDFTEQIAKAMADRAASLRGLDGESRTRLAETVARRLTQIGSVETDLAADIASREADRLAQQQGLATQVGTRATGFVGDTTASLTAAREGLGDQVTDEFEKIAQIVASQARSQGASSQDAMARLGQVANMAAQERSAAPGQLAAEAELALGDEEFGISNQLQQNLSTALAGLDAEGAERLIQESMRQEQHDNQRDTNMINALVGNLIREDTQQFQAGQADLNRGFSKSEREAGELFRTGERLGSETFADLQARAGEGYRTGERIAGQEYVTGEREAGEKFGLMQDALKETVSQAASELKGQSEATLAAQMGYTPDVWAAMTDGMKSKILENNIQQNILQGQGQGAAPEGTMANFRGKNPDVDPAFFQHLDGLYAIEGMGGTRDEIEERQADYLEKLTTDQGGLSSYGPKGLAPRQILEIKTLYNRYKFDIDMALKVQAYQDRFAGPMAASDAAVAAGPNAADTRYLLGPQ